MELVYKLWEGSWEDAAVLRDRARGIFADPAKVHPISHEGNHYRLNAIHLSEPSPQRTPVLYQAGTSSRGKAFAAKHAECVFVSGPSKAVIARYVTDLRQAVVKAGRDPKSLLIYAQALVITGDTEAEAQAKRADYEKHIDTEASLALLSGWTDVDFSRYPLDATIEYIDTDAGRAALASFSQADPNRTWTVGEAARFIGLGGRGPVITGDAKQVASELESWVDETGIDGFNLTFALAHETMRDVVTHVVPELQRRGRYRSEYPQGTLRSKLFRQGARLPANHAGRLVRIDAEPAATVVEVSAA
jgi:FMN-dependent oxidoreductase (nitrilotriacetate monooxygenase family)